MQAVLLEWQEIERQHQQQAEQSAAIGESAAAAAAASPAATAAAAAAANVEAWQDCSNIAHQCASPRQKHKGLQLNLSSTFATGFGCSPHVNVCSAQPDNSFPGRASAKSAAALTAKNTAGAALAAQSSLFCQTISRAAAKPK